MKPSSLILRLLCTVLLCVADASAVILPQDSIKIQGYGSRDIDVRCDSIADFSDVSRYGNECVWNYLYSADGSLIENRGTEWRSHLLSGDTVIYHHRESSRERRDFRIRLLPSSPDTVPYVSITRRDMSFSYIDIGTVKMTAPLKKLSTVVLKEGDTVRNCDVREVVIDFHRYKLPVKDSTESFMADYPVIASILRHKLDSLGSRPVRRIIEKEISWSAPESFTPYATVLNNMVITNQSDTTENIYTTCFPRDINAGSVDTGNLHISGSLERKGSGFITAQPLRVNVMNRSIEVNSNGSFELSVSDLSGINLIYRKYNEPTATESLTRLPAGEYVVIVKSGEETFSQTIILRP